MPLRQAIQVFLGKQIAKPRQYFVDLAATKAAANAKAQQRHPPAPKGRPPLPPPAHPPSSFPPKPFLPQPPPPPVPQQKNSNKPAQGTDIEDEDEDNWGGWKDPKKHE